MCKTKDSIIIGATLLALVFISNTGLACSVEPGPAPLSPSSLPSMPSDLRIPSNYTTYPEEFKPFGISYPSTWESVLYYVADIDKNKEAGNSLDIKFLRARPSIIFVAGLRTETGYDPRVDILVTGTESIPEWTLDQIVDLEIAAIKIGILQGYKEFSRVKTTINGREATIVDFEGIKSGADKRRHYLMMITLTGKTAWRVTCSSTVEDFATWENDFNTILRSFRIAD